MEWCAAWLGRQIGSIDLLNNSDGMLKGAQELIYADSVFGTACGGS